MIVGRERELSGLREALSSVARDRARVLTVVGEAGVGKSHLVTHLGEMRASSKRGRFRHPLKRRHRGADG